MSAATTTHASIINVVLGVAAQGLIGVIIGIAGGIAPIVDAVARFDVYFGDKDASDAVVEFTTELQPEPEP